MGVDRKVRKSAENQRQSGDPTIPTTNFRYCAQSAQLRKLSVADVVVNNKRTKTSQPQTRFLLSFLGVWLSWLEHYVHIVGVGGSSPPTPTTKTKKMGLFPFFLCRAKIELFTVTLSFCNMRMRQISNLNTMH